MRLAPLFLCAACARDAEPESRGLHELERLAFVPPASCTLADGDLPFNHPSSSRAIVIDRFEFTRADLRFYWPHRERRADALAWANDAARPGPDRNQWPAFVDFYEAQELARLRGMRLPTPSEWLLVAVGPNGQTTPWARPGLFANTWVIDPDADFSLNSPCNVGTYENGKSVPYGCYDLLGNVSEWVDGVLPGYEPMLYADGSSERESDDLRTELESLGGTQASLLGGSFDGPLRPTYQFDRNRGRYALRFNAILRDKHTLSPAFGARMCADALTYLWAAAPGWGSGRSAHERVRAVGRRWWAESTPPTRDALRKLLAELRARPSAPPALAWLEEGVLAQP